MATIHNQLKDTKFEWCLNRSCFFLLLCFIHLQARVSLNIRAGNVIGDIPKEKLKPVISKRPHSFREGLTRDIRLHKTFTEAQMYITHQISKKQNHKRPFGC